MKKIIIKSLIICGIISFLSLAAPCTFAVNNSKKATQQIENPEIFNGYMKRMQAKIKSNWDPPKSNESVHVTTLFKISKNGKVSALKILKTSGYSEMDKAAIEAVKKSSPFEALPEEFNGNHVDIQFTFDYNVFRGTKNNDEEEE